MKFRKVSKMVVCGHFVKSNALFCVKNKASLKDMMVLFEFLDSESILTFVLWKKRLKKFKNKEKQFRAVPKWSFLAILSSLFIVRSRREKFEKMVTFARQNGEKQQIFGVNFKAKNCTKNRSGQVRSAQVYQASTTIRVFFSMENRLVEGPNGKALKNMENWLLRHAKSQAKWLMLCVRFKVPKTKQS